MVASGCHGGGGMKDNLTSNLHSKVKKLQYLQVAILVAGSRRNSAGLAKLWCGWPI
jgi:hypothetical protein